MSFNSSQLYGILRIILPSAATYAIGKGWITQDTYGQIGGALAAIVAAGGFSANANTTLNLSKSVAAVPGLQVHVDGTAPPELQKAADDRAVADIVPAAPQPSPYTTSRQR
jgi:hypothetical protein